MDLYVADSGLTEHWFRRLLNISLVLTMGVGGAYGYILERSALDPERTWREVRIVRDHAYNRGDCGFCIRRPAQPHSFEWRGRP